MKVWIYFSGIVEDKELNTVYTQITWIPLGFVFFFITFQFSSGFGVAELI